jgi:hypothetical protein
MEFGSSATEKRFAQVVRSHGQEKQYPAGPASARKPGCDPKEIDALPASVTESFCGVGNSPGLAWAKPPTCLWRTPARSGTLPSYSTPSQPRPATSIPSIFD